MEQIKAIVLRAAGINCDLETEYALKLAGTEAERIHINRIIEDKNALDQYQILVVPGGFSYGDDVAAGKILANQIVHHLFESIQRFIEAGKLVLGICNGFQVLVKAGILPGNIDSSSVPSTLLGAGMRDASCEEIEQNDLRNTQYAIRNTKMQVLQQEVTITNNDSGKYEDRWVYLAPQTDRCIFIEPGRQIYLPVAHGEGKVVTKNESTLQKLRAEGYIAFKYVDENGKEGSYPVNPNGSVDSIAGLTDITGRVLGLMPHPERFVRSTQHPHWTRLNNLRVTNHESRTTIYGDGMTIFNNAVKYIQKNF
jgi:phosphoribosylformylglycinamidine synthase I